MEEIWKPIRGFEGRYEISNKGAVKSFLTKRSGKEENFTTCYLKPSKSNSVGLRRNGKTIFRGIDKLVKTHFGVNEINTTYDKVDDMINKKVNNEVTNIPWYEMPKYLVVKSIKNLFYRNIYFFVGDK